MPLVVAGGQLLLRHDVKTLHYKALSMLPSGRTDIRPVYLAICRVIDAQCCVTVARNLLGTNPLLCQARPREAHGVLCFV